MRSVSLLALVLVGCGSGSDSEAGDEPGIGEDSSASEVAVDNESGTVFPPDDAATTPDTAPPTPCRTRITYGSAWIHGPDHPTQFDDVDGVVTWDGTCKDDG